MRLTGEYFPSRNFSIALIIRLSPCFHIAIIDQQLENPSAISLCCGSCPNCLFSDTLTLPGLGGPTQHLWFLDPLPFPLRTPCLQSPRGQGVYWFCLMHTHAMLWGAELTIHYYENKCPGICSGLCLSKQGSSWTLKPYHLRMPKTKHDSCLLTCWKWHFQGNRMWWGTRLHRSIYGCTEICRNRRLVITAILTLGEDVIPKCWL